MTRGQPLRVFYRDRSIDYRCRSESNISNSCSLTFEQEAQVRLQEFIQTVEPSGVVEEARATVERLGCKEKLSVTDTALLEVSKAIIDGRQIFSMSALLAQSLPDLPIRPAGLGFWQTVGWAAVNSMPRRIPRLGLAVATADVATFSRVDGEKFCFASAVGKKQMKPAVEVFIPGAYVERYRTCGRSDCTQDRCLAFASYQTLVPPIPERIAQNFSNIRDCFIVWEVDHWVRVDTKGNPVNRAHLDPAIVKPIHGDVWELIEVWDLTPLEHAAFGSLLTKLEQKTRLV